MAENTKIKIYKKHSASPDAKDIVINCLGDSITYGVGSDTYTNGAFGDDFMPYHKWWQENYRIKSNNYGISGSYVAHYDIYRGFPGNNARAFVEIID